MIMDSRVHAPPYPHRLHHIIFELFDLKVFYGLLYDTTVWQFSQANVDHKKEQLTCLTPNQHSLT